MAAAAAGAGRVGAGGKPGNAAGAAEGAGSGAGVAMAAGSGMQVGQLVTDTIMGAAVIGSQGEVSITSAAM